MENYTANGEILGSREGFNTLVRHIKKTLRILDDLAEQPNLGDVLAAEGDEGFCGGIGPVLRMVLLDKRGYTALSANISSPAADVPALAAEFKKWKAVDLLAAYHHPDMGLLAANPKSAEALAGFGALKERELLVVYAGKGDVPADDQCVQAARLALALFGGEQPAIPPDLYRGPFPAPPPGKADSPGLSPDFPQDGEPALTPGAPGIQERGGSPPVQRPARVTPRYSVVVGNELFHNGNVEAWKRIIASYNAKYPEFQVYLYYEGERILDINSLFKWGKVKHGSSIQFAVAGRDLKDVAKLRRYLIQGASPQFEVFLQGSVGMVLKLF